MWDYNLAGVILDFYSGICVLAQLTEVSYPVLYKDPLYYLYPFFQILTTPPHLQPQPPVSLLFLLPSFFGWMGDDAKFDVLF